MVKDLEKNSPSCEAISVVRQSSWFRTSSLILADAVGTGVLSLSRALAQLGWGLGLSTLFITVPLFWIAGYFVMKGHIYVDSLGHSARSYGDMLLVIVGPRAQTYGYALVYLIAFMATGSYLLTIAQALQQLFYDVHLCLPNAAVMAVALVLPGTQIRSLHYIAPHAVASFVVLLVVVATALSFLLAEGANCSNDPPGELDFWSAFNAIGSFIWAYAGISYYPEMLAEMKTPQDFARKSFLVAIVLMTTLYAAVSCITYSTCGDGTPDNLVSVIPQGPWLRVSSVLVIYHVTVTYLVSSQVLVLGIVHACGLTKALQPGIEGRTCWFALSFTFTVCAYLVANGVPQFNNLNDLTGNIFCAQGCLVIPAMLWFVSSRERQGKRTFLDRVLMTITGIMFSLGVFLTISGGLSSLLTIWHDAHYKESSKPFSCQALS